MNPWLILAAGALKGVAAGKQRKEQLAMQKAKIPLIKLQEQQQRLFNTVVENYLKRQGYNQMEIPDMSTGALPEAPQVPDIAQPDDYKPAYKSTKSIMQDMGRFGSNLETVPTTQPVQPMGGPTQPQPMGGQDLLVPALIQSMSGGRLPLFDVEREQQRRQQFQQTEKRLGTQFQQQQAVREGTLRPINKEIKGKQFIQWVNYKGDEIGEPVEVSGKKAMTSESAAKFQLARQAVDAAKKLREELVKPNGKIDRLKLMNMVMKTPGSKGRNLAPLVQTIINNKLRGESGAAFGQGEIESASREIIPSILSDDEGILAALDRMDSYVNGLLELYDPNKIYSKDVQIITSEDGRKFALEPLKPQTTEPRTDDQIKQEADIKQEAADFFKKYPKMKRAK